MTTPARATRSMSASSDRFNTSSSGLLSCTKSASRTAPLRSLANVRRRRDAPLASPTRGIPGDDVESPGERPRGPATADDARTDDGEPQAPLSFPPPRVGARHDTAAGRALLRRSLERASGGVRAGPP